MYVTLSLWWYMTLTYWICVYNQILTCKCDICLPYCQLVTLNLSLNMDNRLHNILIRIRNNLLMPDGKLQHYRCSHSKSRICRKIVSLLLRLLLLLLLLLLLIIIIIIIMKTIYAAYLGVYLYTAEKESSSLLLRFLILICRFFVAMIVIIST